MSESPPKQSKERSVEAIAALSKTTLSELRAAHGDLPSTREALVRFFQRGLTAGLSYQECMRFLFFEPSQAGSLFRRVGYADHEQECLIRMVSELPLLDVVPQSTGAEPGASPNGGPATLVGNSGVPEGPPSVS